MQERVHIKSEVWRDSDVVESQSSVMREMLHDLFESEEKEEMEGWEEEGAEGADEMEDRRRRFLDRRLEDAFDDMLVSASASGSGLAVMVVVVWRFRLERRLR